MAAMYLFLSRENDGIHACIPCPCTQFLRSHCLSLGEDMAVGGRGVRMMPFSFKSFLEFLWDPGVIGPCILMIFGIVVQM